MQATHLIEGFSDPVAQTQQVFRQALGAMSEPGLILDVQPPGGDRQPSVPGSLCDAAWALCLTLLDNETSVWISPVLDGDALRQNLAFHCGCRIVETRGEADFALLAADDLDDLGAFHVGTDRDPHESCSLIVQLPGLAGGTPTTWHGPGIQATRQVRLPVPPGFWQQRKLHAFPQGLDMFFTADGQVMGLPRSTRVIYAVKEEA